MNSIMFLQIFLRTVIPFSQFSHSVMPNSLEHHGLQHASSPSITSLLHFICHLIYHLIHHQLLELTQTHVHKVSDTIQPSHPLLSPSLPAPIPSQHQSLFQ